MGHCASTNMKAALRRKTVMIAMDLVRALAMASIVVALALVAALGQSV